MSIKKIIELMEQEDFVEEKNLESNELEIGEEISVFPLDDIEEEDDIKDIDEDIDEDKVKEEQDKQSIVGEEFDITDPYTMTLAEYTLVAMLFNGYDPTPMVENYDDLIESIEKLQSIAEEYNGDVSEGIQDVLFERSIDRRDYLLEKFDKSSPVTSLKITDIAEDPKKLSILGLPAAITATADLFSKKTRDKILMMWYAAQYMTFRNDPKLSKMTIGEMIENKKKLRTRDSYKQAMRNFKKMLKVRFQLALPKGSGRMPQRVFNAVKMAARMYGNKDSKSILGTSVHKKLGRLISSMRTKKDDLFLSKKYKLYGRDLLEFDKLPEEAQKLYKEMKRKMRKNPMLKVKDFAEYKKLSRSEKKTIRDLIGKFKKDALGIVGRKVLQKAKRKIKKDSKLDPSKLKGWKDMPASEQQKVKKLLNL